MLLTRIYIFLNMINPLNTKDALHVVCYHRDDVHILRHLITTETAYIHTSWSFKELMFKKYMYSFFLIIFFSVLIYKSKHKVETQKYTININLYREITSTKMKHSSLFVSVNLLTEKQIKGKNNSKTYQQKK